jgi:AraC-like DNA-binding protein
LFDLLMHEITRLPVRELGLPFPEKPSLAVLCKEFLKAPDPAASIDNWAQRLSMSRRSFTRLFRAQTGVSFVMWRQQACIFASLPKLASGESITSVAFDTGYESAAAFTTMFKRMLGASPRDYMRQQAGNAE